MPSLSWDEKALLRLYDAAVSPDLWSQVLQGLARRADAVGCCFAIDNVKDRAAFPLDVQGRVSQMNASAEALLGRDLELCRGRLRTASPKDEAALQNVLAAVLAPPFPSGAAEEEPIVIGSANHRGLVIEALPTVGLLQDVFVGTRALLLMTELSPFAALPKERLRKLFRLTAAEAAVASRIAAGGDVREVAETLKIATGTARNHLKAIFSKTGTQRQSELVALVQRIRLG